MDFVRPMQAVIPGAQGRVLAVLAETTAELNLRTLARLAGISVAQASRVMPGLVELGLVERREVPPSSQFRLNREHVAAEAILDLSRSRERALRQIGDVAASLPVPPVAVIVFGSIARAEAGPESDLDVVVVRPDHVADDDEGWGTSIEQWRERARAITGNPVEVIEVDLAEARRRLASTSTLWRDISRDGIAVHGLSVTDLSRA
jgi:predicted nucleotidyltransferase